MKLFPWILLITIPLVFFWKIWTMGLLPMPLDTLVGLYHPFRDFYAQGNPNGVSYKNYILTDPVLQQYPWKWLAIQNWKNGKIPFENPYNFSGTPLFANPQAGALYPLNFLFFLGPFQAMWSIYIVIQPILAALFMYFFLRSLSSGGAGSREARRQARLSSISSLFGGLVWAFSSFNLVWLEWGNIGHAGLWLPLALFSSNKLLSANNKKDKKYWWHFVFQLSLIMSFLAGHPQITFYIFIATALYWVIRFGISKRPVFFFTVHCLLFTLIVSPQWVPALRFSLTSNRDIEQQDSLTREGFFIRPRQLVQLIAPDFFGNPATLNYRGDWNYAEQVLYIGMIPLVLGVLGGLWKFSESGENRDLEKTRYFSIALVIGSLLFAVRNPIAQLPYRLHLPILSDFQPTRLSFLTTFGLSIFAAIGLEQIVTLSKNFERKVFKITGLIGIILFSLLIISSKFSQVDKLVSQRNLIFPTILLIGFVGGISGIRMIRDASLLGKGSTTLLASCFVLLVSLVDLFHFGWKFTPFSPQQYLYPVTPAIHFLQEHMNPDDRYMTLDRRLLPPNANIMYGLKSIEGYDPLYSKEYATLISAMESGQAIDQPQGFGRIIRPVNFRSPVAQQLHARYVLSLNEIIDPFLTEVFREGDTKIYESNLKGS